jgi:hypothetical protein
MDKTIYMVCAKNFSPLRGSFSLRYLTTANKTFTLVKTITGLQRALGRIRNPSLSHP